VACRRLAVLRRPLQPRPDTVKVLDPRPHAGHTAFVRNRLQIWLAVLLIALAGFLMRRSLLGREPVYQGKSLSVWLAIAEREDLNELRQSPAGQAIRGIGTNALPTLLEMLRTGRGTLKQALIERSGRQRWIHLDLKSADKRRAQALTGFAVLGPLASAAVPSLSNTLTSGPTAELRWAAAMALGFIGPEARPAAPALLRATKDLDAEVRCDAFWALRQIRPDAQTAVPVLVDGLNDPWEIARQNAAAALESYGPEAEAAVPTLIRMSATNQAARRTLKRIDPAAAVKADAEDR